MKEMKEDGVKAMKTKILVVDDEKPIADILEFNLDKEGYDVFVAYDGNEAIDLVRTEEPDLVLLDIMLPEKDGMEVCRGLPDADHYADGEGFRDR